jgi:hypothetical protein
MADRGGVCDACRRRLLEDPAAPTLRPRVWALAGLVVFFLTIGSSLIAAAVMTHRSLPWRHDSILSTKSPITYQNRLVVEQTTRTVYPYSIVPGGAENLDEAKRAMNDPAVRANYADINFTKLRQVKLKKNLSGFVSYRSSDKIYWTSTEQTLRVGEIVFTDGVHLVRGRCLNGYSPDPALPVGSNEPSEQVLDRPAEIPVIAYSFQKLPVEAPDLPPNLEALTPTVPPGAGLWFPLTPIIPPIHGHPSIIPPAR